MRLGIFNQSFFACFASESHFFIFNSLLIARICVNSLSQMVSIILRL